MSRRRNRQRAETVTVDTAQALIAASRPVEPETRCAWAFWPTPGGGWAWQRMLLPISVVEQYASGPQAQPDVRGVAMAKIENELASDKVVTRKGW